MGELSLIDTHCHIHDSEFQEKFHLSPEKMLARARSAGVTKLICVGTSVKSSREAIAFAEKHDGVFASIALHPHEAELLNENELDAAMEQLALLKSEKIVAIGECGFDYFYYADQRIRAAQQKLVQQHFELAKVRKLPMIFHIRNAKGTDGQKNDTAFCDFMASYDSYKPAGVVHSFSATVVELEMCLQRGLFAGLNGILTFSKDESQLLAAKNIPLESIVLETDAPYLTPVPFRGSINEPKHVTNITQFLSELRDESHALVAKQTTKNAKQLFNL